jgi:hypothetical protein
MATVLALALLVPSAAQAQTQLPVGESHGVRLVVERGSAVLIFSHRSAKLRKRINSPYAWISCTHLGGDLTSVNSGNLDVRRHGRRVRTGFGAAHADFCRVFLRSHTVKRHGTRIRLARRVLFSIPVTQAGAVFLDEESKTDHLLAINVIASLLRHDKKLAGVPTYAQLVQAYPAAAKVVVALAAPGDAPPPDRVGYYSDGQEHLVVSILSASGGRLFIETAAGNVLSTNVAVHIFGDRL